MQRITIICGALVLMSVPCLAQSKPGVNPEQVRTLAAIERRDAVLRDLLDSHERCLDEKAKKRREAESCAIFDEKMNQTPIDVFTTFPPLTSPTITLPADEARRLAIVIFYNIWAGYEHGRRKALDGQISRE